MTQEELDALIAQAALDDLADAEREGQQQEAKQQAKARIHAFIARCRRQHTIPSVAINRPHRGTPCLVQYESEQCRMLRDVGAACWQRVTALGDALAPSIQASG